MKNIILIIPLLFTLLARAQRPDHTYRPNIHSVKLFKYADIYGYPIISLNSGDQLELHFDDFDADVKNYYYTFQLCNADWEPANLPGFDYIQGFQTTRISTYRYSSVSFTKYTHYQAILPQRSSAPTKSGNYLLKVFLDNDTSDLYFTKRFLVIDNKVSVAVQIKQPFSSQSAFGYQRVQIVVNTATAKINNLSPQDLKVVVLQNNIWPSAAFLNRPTIYRGNYFEYNDDATSFEAGREWRWVDLRSLLLMSDRMEKLINTNHTPKQVYLKPDGERKQQAYMYYRDLNGIYTIENTDGNNPYWQSDYAYVHFRYAPPGGRPYAGKDIYVFGELTNYLAGDSSRMAFNTEKGVYEKTIYLKQGHYNYSYAILDAAQQPGNRFSFDSTEGSFVQTENNYTILVYFRPFGARADELIGVSLLNTLTGK